MNTKRAAGAVLVLVASAVLLTGCNVNAAEANGAEANGTEVNRLTWQDAKRDAQATELKIAALIPKDQVTSIDQMPEGTLLSCDKKRHQWAGQTTVTLLEGTDETKLVKQLADHFRTESEFTVEEYIDITERSNVQLIAKDGEESYIVGVGIKVGSIEIASGSACFTLPEGVYPRGNF